MRLEVREIQFILRKLETYELTFYNQNSGLLYLSLYFNSFDFLSQVHYALYFNQLDFWDLIENTMEY